MNRIVETAKLVRDALDKLDEDKLAKADATMAIDFEEHFTFQRLQSEMHAGGRLTIDEALTVYNALGEVGSDANGGWAEDTDTATKITVTNLMAGALAERVGRREMA
jgi:hypothetical protein